MAKTRLVLQIAGSTTLHITPRKSLHVEEAIITIAVVLDKICYIDVRNTGGKTVNQKTACWVMKQQGSIYRQFFELFNFCKGLNSGSE